MSYLGYTERLCTVGHRDVTDHYADPRLTCHCGRAWAWSREVDLTNGYDPSNPATAPYPLEVVAEAVIQVCNLDHEHLIEPTRYRIPAVGPRATDTYQADVPVVREDS